MTLHPIYLVMGDEHLLVREKCAELVARALEGGTAAFNSSARNVRVGLWCGVMRKSR